MTKDVISLSISVLLLFRHYISHKITFGAPSSGGVLCSACGAFIEKDISCSFFSSMKKSFITSRSGCNNCFGYILYEPVHEISNDVVCATSEASDQPAHTRSLIRAFASRLSIL